MKQKFFDIQGRCITLIPNDVFKKVGLIFLIVFPGIWLPLLVISDLLQWKPFLIMAVTNVVVVLPFFYISSKQVIVNGQTKTVRYKNWFRIKDAYHFSEIADVIFVTQLIYNTKNSGYYTLTLKRNPYGKSIKLTMEISKASKQYEALNIIAIPFIKNLLTEYKSLSKEKVVPIANLNQFTMFRQQGNYYISKPVKTINLAVAFVCFGLGVMAVYYSVSATDSKKEYYWIIAFVAAAANMGLWGERLKIDPAGKTIEKSYLGLAKKAFAYQYIIGFSTIKHVTGFGNNGIDIMAEIKTTAGTDQVKLFSRISSRKVQVLIGELKQILNDV